MGVTSILNLLVVSRYFNPNKLNRFITAAESVLTHYYVRLNQDNFQNILLLNKLEARPKDIAMNGCKPWEQIRDTLIPNFSRSGSGQFMTKTK